LKQNTQKEILIFLICIIVGCALAIPYRDYLISKGYKYGLANLDMQYYMSLAEQIKEMNIPLGFKTISHHWNFANVNHIQIWGYRIYIYYLVATVFKWTFLPVAISVYLVSIWQIMLANYTLLRIFNSIKKEFIIYDNASLFLMLTAPPVWYGCVRLLREPFMLLGIELLISSICRKEKNWGIKCVIGFALLTIMRPYYSLFMVPLMLLIANRERIALIVESCIFATLAVICIFLKIEPLNIISVVLSPNFFNQVKTISIGALNVDTVSGQIPLIIFIGSIWNIIMLFYSIISLFINRKFNIKCWCCAGLILDVCMIYSITAGGASELRHKMFFVIPFIILLNQGVFTYVDQNGITAKTVIINIILLNFLAIYALISQMVL
jgi:hypothetical protein